MLLVYEHFVCVTIFLKGQGSETHTYTLKLKLNVG